MPGAGLETFIVMQYSVGIGHLTRCSALAKAFASISHVSLFSGGKPIESYSPPTGFDFVQLPPLYRPGAGELPAPVDARYTLAEAEALRSKMLVDAYRRLKPKIVITEYFPFAPRRFGRSTLDELIAVISREQEKPMVICSLRVFPHEEVPDLDEDAMSVNAYLKRHYDCVLHHVDPRFFPLSSLGAHAQEALAGVPVWQTGFVRRPFVPRNVGPTTIGLLLTVGGGSAAGARLMQRWINAAKNGVADLLPVVAVCGPLMDRESRNAVHALQGPDVAVYDWVSNMDQLIGASRGVVCLGGYNTLVEALSEDKPVLSFPYSGLGDQIFQVSALQKHGILLRGDPAQSDREITAQMNALLKFRPKSRIDFSGAERSVKIVRQAIEG
jgi:predicted glycosyltransferase